MPEPNNPFGVKLKKRAPSGRAKVGKQLTGLADTPPKPSPAKSPSKNLSPQKSKKAVTPPAAPPPPPPPLSAEAAEIAELKSMFGTPSANASPANASPPARPEAPAAPAAPAPAAPPAHTPDPLVGEDRCAGVEVDDCDPLGGADGEHVV